MSSLREQLQQLHPRRVLPSPTEAESARAVERLGRPLPQQLRDVLSVTAGLDLNFALSLCGGAGGQDLSELCPHKLQIAEDGFGNGWILDCDAPPSDECRVLFACHDPPILMAHNGSITEFVQFVVDVEKGRAVDQLDDQLNKFLEGPGTIVEGGRTRTIKPRERATIDLTRAKAGDGFWWSGEESDFAARRIGSGPVFEVWRD